MSKLLVFCVLVWSAQAGRSRAQADPAADVARAEEYAAEAFDAYSRQDYSRAVTLYRLALDAAASPDIIYNLARIYDIKLRDRSLALEFYQRYAADPAANPDRARIVSGRLVALRELERIQVDSKRAPRSAAASGEAAGPRAESGAVRAPADSARSGLTGLQVASIVVGTAGIAGFGVGLAFGIDAKTKADVSHEFCDGNVCTTPRGVDAAKHASSSATVSTVAFIAGGVFVAAGVTMLLVSPSGSRESDARARLIPYADRYGAGAQWIGRW